MKKLFTLIISFALVSFIVASCGGDSAKANDANKDADNTEVKVEDNAVVEDEPAAESDELAQEFQKGKEVYDKICYTCHKAGIAGAAKLDDKERWEESAAKGKEALYSTVKNGVTGDYGVMPAKGSCADCSDEELQAAVDYMLHEAGVTAE